MTYSVRLPSAFTSASGKHPSLAQIKEYTSELANFISRFQWLSSIHAYDSLHQDFFLKTWPAEWRKLADESFFNADHFVALVKSGEIQSDWPPSLQDYVKTALSLQLPRTVISSEFGSVLKDAEYLNLDSGATTASGMNRKKLHEVDRFARVILDLIKRLGTNNNSLISSSLSNLTIMDIGAGQGYLTHRLSAEYPCVAVDFDQIQTVGSVSRGEKIKAGKLKDILDSTSTHVARKPVTYKTIRIDSETLEQLLYELESESSTGGKDKKIFALVGLHACGDLSATAMLKTFRNCESVKLLAVVPCCFNLLTEPESPFEVTENHGFPMSSHIRSLCEEYTLTLGHKGRNLACQNFDRFNAAGIESNLTGHYKRSLLDALLWHFNLEPQQHSISALNSNAKPPLISDTQRENTNVRKQHKFRLGKLPLESFQGNFTAYALVALERLGLKNALTESQIDEFISLPQYVNAKRQIFVVHCVKSLMSRVLESFILMDRFLTIIETMHNTGVEVEVEMLNLFDIEESPRNMVFLAKKVQ